MKINYIEIDRSVEIKDGFKTQYYLLVVMMVLNIINAILFPVFVLEEKPMAWFGFIWIIIGIFSVLALFYQVFKKSGAEKLKVSEISALKETQFLGRKKISIKLKNGKLRDLIQTKTASEILEIKIFFQNHGIETV